MGQNLSTQQRRLLQSGFVLQNVGPAATSSDWRFQANDWLLHLVLIRDARRRHRALCSDNHSYLQFPPVLSTVVPLKVYRIRAQQRNGKGFLCLTRAKIVSKQLELGVPIAALFVKDTPRCYSQGPDSR